MNDYTELKRLAEAAAKHGWYQSGAFGLSRITEESEESFVVAASPAAVLALIAENERLKSVSNFQEAVACVFDFAKIAAANTGCRDWDEQLDEFAGDVIEFAPEYKRQWLDIVKLAADNERLKADFSSMRGSLKANAASIKKLIKDGRRAAREIDQLKAENETMRKNSERYVWLRDKSENLHGFYLSTPLWMTGVRFSKQNVDDTIDAAMLPGDQS